MLLNRSSRRARNPDKIQKPQKQMYCFQSTKMEILCLIGRIACHEEHLRRLEAMFQGWGLYNLMMTYCCSFEQLLRTYDSVVASRGAAVSLTALKHKHDTETVRRKVLVLAQRASCLGTKGGTC
jgi:hypothetical protein